MIIVFVIIILLAVIYWLFMSPFSQVFGGYPWRVATKDKVIALTFDDGPNEPYTSEIADYLAEKKIKATFFQVGECINRYPETTKRLHQDGHVIGNHSVHHRFLDYFVHPTYRQEIVDNQKIITDLIGVQPALFRSPWLWRQPALLRTLRQLNIQPVSGEFCHELEVFQPSGQSIAKRTLAKIKPGSIIIFHDGFDAKGGNRTQTVTAVKITIDELINLGYRFVTISELLQVPAYQ